MIFRDQEELPHRHREHEETQRKKTRGKRFTTKGTKEHKRGKPGEIQKNCPENGRKTSKIKNMDRYKIRQKIQMSEKQTFKQPVIGAQKVVL